MTKSEALKLIKRARIAGDMILDLSENQLTSLPGEIGQLTSLRQLNLSENQLTSLPGEIGQLTSLRQLNLRENQLTSLPGEIGQLTSLRQLNLSGNQLTSLPGEIVELTSLKQLNLRGNQLTSLPGEIVELTSLQQLYLSGNQLTSLPGEIVQLTSLQSLDLSGNSLTSLPGEIVQLTSLRQLNLRGNQLASLPGEIGQLTSLRQLDLHGNQLTSLPGEIGQLTSLRQLDLHGNQLTSLPGEIVQLTSLQQLYLSGNQLTSLPGEIVQLTSLQYLDLRENQLTSLPGEIVQLTSLQRLDLSENQLTSLPGEIGQLTSLQYLALNGNQLTTLPPEIGQLSNLTELNLSGNPLPIPPEILNKASSPKEILDYYLQITTTQTRPLNEAKLLVVGEASVGKTSLIKRLLGQKFDAHENMTEGIERHQWKIGSGDEAIRLNVWDFGGQEIMHATHQFFLTKRSLYLLVIDSRENERQSRIGYWLRVIESFGGDSPVIVVCNKCDQQRADLDWSGLRAKHENLRGFARAVSCAGESQGIPALRADIERQVTLLDHVRDQFPANWFTIKKQLEDMKDSYLSYEEYRRLCESHGVENEDDRKRLVGFLHDLGTVLHFHDHPILQTENILNPDWVTKGVYCIVTRDELKGKGVLRFDKLGSLLPQEQYPTRRQHLFIVEMMRRFELCFDFEGQSNQKFLIPGLLPKEKPSLGDWSDSLHFQYRYDVLPDSVISRFIVRMHTFIDGQQYWRTGVVLASQDGGNRALIEADLDDGIISISVTGDGGGRRRFLEALRASFYCIHSTLRRIGVKEFVPLRDHPTDVIAYDRLVQFERHNKDEDFVEIDGTLISVPIKEYLDGVSDSANRYPEPTVKLFYSYSHNDEEFRKEFEKHLSILSRQGAIKEWHDRKITAGEEWKRKIDHNLEQADLILLLVSSDFLASDYCYDIETKRAMERHEAGEARVIPVILRSCDWHDAPFGKLQALPKDAKPIKSWDDIDEAFTDVAKGIRRAVDKLRDKGFDLKT